jgi:hypothetical protein
MADNSKKIPDNNRRPTQISESNTGRTITLGEDSKKNIAIEVRNAMPAPPNPNKGKGSK